MFERKSTGISFESDGTVRIVELTATPRHVVLSRAATYEAGGEDAQTSWEHGLEEARGAGVDLENAVIGLPDSLIYRKSITFPFSSRKRILQVLQPELEGEIPVPSETVVADYIPGKPHDGGLQITVLACDRNTLSRFLDMSGGGTGLAGVQTAAVGLATAVRRAGLVNGLAVHCSTGEALLLEMRSSRVRSVRRLPMTGEEDPDTRQLVSTILGMTEDGDEVFLACPDLLEPVTSLLHREESLQVRPFIDLSMVDGLSTYTRDPSRYVPALGLALGGLGGRESLALDLRQGPFRRETPLTALKTPLVRTGVLSLLVLLLGAGSLVTGMTRAKGEYQSYTTQLEREFAQVFPDITLAKGGAEAQITDELEKLKRKAADMSGFEGRGALVVLAKLSAAIPADISVKLDELSYDTKKLRLEGSVSSFDSVDRIKSALESEPIFQEVQVQNARVGADVNKVTFRLAMEVR